MATSIPKVEPGGVKVRNPEFRIPMKAESQYKTLPGIYSQNNVTQFRTPGFNKDLADLQIRMFGAGRIPETGVTGLSTRQFEVAFANLLTDANANGMSYDDVLRLGGLPFQNGSGPSGSGSGSGSNGGSGSGPRTIVSKQTNITSFANARNLLRQTLREELGREPTNAEIKQFQSGLNAKEKASPTVTTTRTNASGSVTSSTTKQSNVDAQDEAVQGARRVNTSESKMYRGSEYFNVIASMIGGGG